MLSILMLEDSDLDADLIRSKLRKAGLRFEVRRATSRAEFVEALAEAEYDLILSDYEIPSFGGFEALELFRRDRPDTPFLFISGAIGEERAIESLKLGATDYLLKQRLDRLEPAIARALAEVDQRRSRREAERALRESLERNRLILENIKDYAIFSVDRDGRVVTWNAGAESVFGHVESETLGRPLPPLLADPAPESPPTGEHLDGEHLYRRRSGETFWGSGRIRPLLDDDGRRLGDVHVVHDMTERKRFEEALREADRRKDDFLAMLGHELRNPLAAIASSTQLIRRTEGDRDFDWAFRAIERQTRHLGRLVEDLLDISRISRGKIELRMTEVDPIALIRSAVEVVRPAVDGRGQALTVSLPDGPYAMTADGTRIEQVVGNLLTNASKYTPDGGTLGLDATVEGETLVIAVRDDGIGIAPDLLESIFQPFVQAEQGIDRAQGGLGIGLTLARDLTRLHHGTLEARSDGLNRGSVFTVRLPGIGRVEAAGSPPAPRPAGPRQARRVLVVDDNLFAARATAELLRLDGHDVATVHDGLAALAEVERHRPDVVILDIGLPGIDGFEVAERLIASAGGRPPLIVGVSGYGDAGAIERSRSIGFDHYLIKPVDMDSLLAIVATGRPG